MPSFFCFFSFDPTAHRKQRYRDTPDWAGYEKGQQRLTNNFSVAHFRQRFPENVPYLIRNCIDLLLTIKTHFLMYFCGGPGISKQEAILYCFSGHTAITVSVCGIKTSGLIHTGRVTRCEANGTCCRQWECSYSTQATSKEKRSILRTRRRNARSEAI